MGDEDFKVKDVVQHVFKKTKYVILDIRTEKTFSEKVGEVIAGKDKGELYCESENGERGWLHKNLVKKVN